MSDEDALDDDSINLQEIYDDAKESLSSGRMFKIDMEDFSFTEIVDLKNYLITKDYLVQDLRYKVNNRRSKLNKRIKKGNLYGSDQ